MRGGFLSGPPRPFFGGQHRYSPSSSPLRRGGEGGVHRSLGWTHPPSRSSRSHLFLSFSLSLLAANARLKACLAQNRTYSTRISPYVHLLAWVFPLRASRRERVWARVGPNERN